MIRLFTCLIMLLFVGARLDAAPRERGFDFFKWKGHSKTLLPLDQGWTFVPQTFADPRDFRNWRAQTKPVEMPILWDKLQDFGKITHGTYLLEVKNFPSTLITPSISNIYIISAYRFYVVYEGKAGELRSLLLAKQGKAGTTPGSSVPWRELDVYSWPADIKPLAFVVQVSNFENFFPGGFREKPLLGDARIAREKRDGDWLEAVLVYGMLVMIGLFNLALYLQRREDKSSLYLFFFCFFASLRYMGLENMLFYFQKEPQTWLWRLNWALLRGFMIGPMFAAYITFFYHAFHKAIDVRYIKFFWAYVLVMAPVSTYFAFFPSTLSYPVWIVGSIFMLAYTILVGLRLYEIARQNVPGSHLAAFSLVALVLATTHDTLVFSKAYSGPYLGRYVLVAFALMQSLIIAQRFSIAFRKLLTLEKGLRREVMQQTLEIKSMLDHLNQGLFLFGPDRRIQPHYSKLLEEILGDRQLAGKDALELLFAGSDVPYEVRERLHLALSRIFGRPLEEAESLGTIIREFKKAIPSQPQRILAIDWSTIAGGTGTVEKILVTVRDITTIRSLEKDSEARRTDTEISHQILAIPDYVFIDFIENSYAILEKNQALIDQNRSALETVVEPLLCNIYDLHSAAKVYRFQILIDLLKVSQERLIRYVGSQDEIDGALLRNEVNEMRNALQRYEWINQEQLGRKTDRDLSLVKRKEIKESLKALTEIGSMQLPQDAKGALDSVRKQMAATAFCSPQLVTEEMLIILQRLAKERGRDTPRLELDSESVYLTQDGLMKLRSIFIHMARNSLDHGIESREERLRNGKPGVGSVMISIALNGDSLRIAYRDDGRGLPLGRMLQTGVQEGTFSSSSTPEAVVAALWNPSQGKNANAGKGLGLVAIRQHVETGGGQIRIQLDSNSKQKEYCPFVFEMALPRNFYFSA